MSCLTLEQTMQGVTKVRMCISKNRMHRLTVMVMMVHRADVIP